MKFWAVNIALVLVLLTTIGCERRDPADDNSTAFDPDLDPAARMISVETDPDIMEDQAKISRQASEGKSPRRTTGSADAADMDPVELVKGKVAAAIAGIKANDPEPMLAMFDDEAAQLLSPMIRGGVELEQRSLAFQYLLETELGIELRGDLRSIISETYGVPTSDLKVDSIGELTFEMDDEKVIVTTPEGNDPYIFVAVDSDYRATLTEVFKDPRIVQTFAMLNDITQAQITFIDEVTADIEAGEITRDNLEPKTNAIADRTVRPVKAKFLGGRLPQTDQPDAEPQPDEAPDEEPTRGRRFRNSD